jgi:PAS domain S-box-containing protein
MKRYTTYVNSRWCEISGISFQNAIGNGWLNAVHPDDRNILFEDWNVAASNEEISVSEYRFLKPDGQIVWVMAKLQWKGIQKIKLWDMWAQLLILQTEN